MDQQIYSNTVNRIGNTELTLWSAWRDTVLVGVATAGGVATKQWLKQGDFLEFEGRRWLMLELLREQSGNGAGIMIHLVAVE